MFRNYNLTKWAKSTVSLGVNDFTELSLEKRLRIITEEIVSRKYHTYGIITEQIAIGITTNTELSLNKLH